MGAPVEFIAHNERKIEFEAGKWAIDPAPTLRICVTRDDGAHEVAAGCRITEQAIIALRRACDEALDLIKKHRDLEEQRVALERLLQAQSAAVPALAAMDHEIDHAIKAAKEAQPAPADYKPDLRVVGPPFIRNATYRIEGTSITGRYVFDPKDGRSVGSYLRDNYWRKDAGLVLIEVFPNDSHENAYLCKVGPDGVAIVPSEVQYRWECGDEGGSNGRWTNTIGLADRGMQAHRERYDCRYSHNIRRRMKEAV